MIGTEDRCRVCGRGREEGSEYCSYHQRAYASLREAFERWRRAMDVDWRGFLREVCGNSKTGEWAREVAEALLKGEPP